VWVYECQSSETAPTGPLRLQAETNLSIGWILVWGYGIDPSTDMNTHEPIPLMATRGVTAGEAWRRAMVVVGRRRLASFSCGSYQTRLKGAGQLSESWDSVTLDR
jgi:hypothetical protein